MTAMPPPNAPIGYPPPQQVSQTNVAAIISLICGIIGCFLVTPFIGIISGIVGVRAKPPVGGKGMAVAGIILSIIWIIGLTSVGGAMVWAYKQVPQLAKAPAISVLNQLADGNVSGAASATNLSESELQPLADAMKQLGHCKDLTVNSPSYANNNGDLVLGFSGVGTFENGVKNVDVVVEIPSGKPPKVTSIKIE